MATTPRAWPNNAREARDRSAELAADGLRALTPLLSDQFTRDEEIRRIGRAVNALQNILRFLEREGAQTRPV